MHLIEVGFGTRQDDGEGQVKSKGRECDDGQTKVTSSAFSRRFHILGVIHLIYVTRDVHRFFLAAFPAGYMKDSKWPPKMEKQSVSRSRHPQHLFTRELDMLEHIECRNR